MLRSKDGTEIDFMCLTMIDPASSWFEIVELLVVELSPTSPSKINSLTAMDIDLHPLFLGLRKFVITSRIFVLKAS